MVKKSLSNNALLNIFRNFVNILFPLISFPYISRVLGPENLGEINYILSVTAYFTLISTFGIPIYGTRELAKVRDNKEKFNRVANDLFIISTITTLITYLLYVIVILFVPQFSDHKHFFLIAGFLILFNNIGIEWLYQAMEDFLFITIRSIVIKITSLLLMFYFVRTSGDDVNYLIILVFATVGANIFNLIYSKKYIAFKFLKKKINIKMHMRPLLILFGSSLVSSIYLGMDVFILGMITDEFYHVGLYAAAIKINRIAITIIASVSMVLIPRVSYYIKSGEHDKYRSLLQRALDINLLFALPVVAYMILFSKEIIYVISGELYLDAALTMQLITPMILCAAITNIIYNQVLIPYNKEKVIFIAAITGVAACILLNIMLVPLYKQNGTALATLITEIIVMVVEVSFVFSMVKNFFFSRSQINSVIATVIMIMGLIIVKLMCNDIYFALFYSLTFSLISYFGALLLLKDSNIIYFSNKIKKIIK